MIGLFGKNKNKKKIEQAIAREVREKYKQKVSMFNCANECKGNLKYYLELEDGTVLTMIVNDRYLDNPDAFVFL